MPAIDLNKPRSAEKLSAPGWYSHIGQPSFGVRVASGGTRSWYWQGRVNGRQVWRRIGGCGDMRFEDAQAVALELGRLRGLAQRGEAAFPDAQPARSDSDVAAPYRVADVWAFYWQQHGRTTKRAANLEKLWRRHCQDIAARSLLELDVEQVQAWHDDIARDAPIVALHAYQALRAAARLGMRKPSASGWPKGHANPFSGVETRKARPRRRRLEGADLAAFGAAALEHPDVAVRTFLLALHVTGARVSELRLATIQQYDRARRVIEWPTSKNEDPRVLTLGPVTARLLEHVLGKRTTGLIWPGGCQDSGFDFRKAWAATCKAAGVTRYTFHDARRSFAEALASAGDPAFSDLRLEELLGHRLQGVQANYRYLDVHSPVRAKAAAAVEAALGLARRTEKPQVRRSK